MSKLVKYQLIKQKVENEHNAMSEFHRVQEVVLFVDNQKHNLFKSVKKHARYIFVRKA